MNKPAATAAVIRIICPNLKCRAILSTPVKTRGQSVRCRMCGSRIRVPTDGAAPKGDARDSKA